jgi:hypothetical protein
MGGPPAEVNMDSCSAMSRSVVLRGRFHQEVDGHQTSHERESFDSSDENGDFCDGYWHLSRMPLSNDQNVLYLSVNGAPAARTPGQNRTAGRGLSTGLVQDVGAPFTGSPWCCLIPILGYRAVCQIVSAGAGLAGSGGVARCVFPVRARVDRWDCLWFEPARTTGRPIYSGAIELWSRPAPCGCAGIANSSSEASPRGS